ncbi:MAG: phosphoenolpyruvate carboxykinase [Caloramator sp.]|nr:phosphoenolpyruvate carboxykinase [Caloramator sp.]
MKKEFSLSNGKVMINFTAKYCDTPEKLLNSEGFQRILKAYLKKIQRKNSAVYKYICESFKNLDIESITKELITVFKMLVTLNVSEIIKLNSSYKMLLTQKENFIDMIEGIYGFWRRLERYTIISDNKTNEGLQNVSFIDANSQFSALILNLYRKISENVSGVKPNVYRQLPAGANAALVLSHYNWLCPKEYEILKDIPFIETISLDPPFIAYPKKNTREGFFSEIKQNPLSDSTINPDHWFCYPAKVGSLLSYIYFHRDFMSHGISLCNLFELATKEECTNTKPDIIYVFGARDKSEKLKTVFFDDLNNDIMMGYVSYGEAIDYFGYMKKMTLTLHNLIMIKRGYLPIHGAMVSITLKSGKHANIIIMGDSGAGKSETLEAFRSLGEEYISDMLVIFDDMGALKLNGNDKPLAFGTEIGAFVRLDDLDPGYAFRELDRSIFMNPDKVNARLVIPISSYKDIMKGYPIDMFLYANNYEDVEDNMPHLEFFSDINKAIRVFKDGARMAKGTTSEKGLVKSYFANPFGPYQRQKETDILLNEYFNAFYKAGVKVGQIKTCLGISGKEKIGPKNAAIKLFEEVNNL